MPERVYIETYGCTANQGDSEIIAGLLQRAGFTIVEKPENAEIGIINTCVVKESTEKRMIYRIQKLKNFFGNKLIVAGCMPVAEYKKIRKITNASLVGPKGITEIVKVVKKVSEGKRIEILNSKKPKICLPRIRRNPVIAIVQISEGCLSGCSFCLTRYARGRLVSYPPEKIVSEIKLAKQAGCKEFWLTSQDNGCYGFDLGISLPELVKKILKDVKGNYFLRIGMMNPLHVKRILNELIEVYQDPRVYKFIHLPLQSGSDNVLEKMNRGYTVRDVVQFVESFRREFSMLTFWTDMIVGFPGETERDFLQSLKILEKLKPDFTNISRFSSMPGTPASRMKQLPSEIKKQRSRKMRMVTDRLAEEQNRKWLNWCGKVLIDEYNSKKGSWIGKNFAYKQIIIPGQHKLGKYVQVKIIKFSKTHLVGKPIQPKDLKEHPLSTDQIQRSIR